MWLVCLTIKHAQITPGGALYIVNDIQDLQRTIGAVKTTFVGLPFEVVLPGQEQEQAINAALRIDNVDRRIMQAIRGLTGPPTADLEVVLASSPNTVEVGYYAMTMRAVTFDQLYVSSDLSFEQIFVEPVSLSMTPERFPGMF